MAAVNTSIYMFGGTSSTGTRDPQNSLVKLNIQDKTIYTVTEEIFLPSARYSHSMNLINNKFVLFGGKGRSSLLNDMYLYDTETEV